MSEQPALPHNKIALVIDGVVQDVFHTDDRLAAILLSNPTIVDVTEKYANQDPSFHLVQWTYDGADFAAPEVQTELN
jgi:hypothetical protein